MSRETVCLSWNSAMLILMRFFSVPVLSPVMVSSSSAKALDLGARFGFHLDSQLDSHRLGQLGLSYSGWSQEEEARDRPLAAVQACSRESDGFSDGGERRLLAHNSLAEDGLEIEEARAVAT